MLSIIRTMDGIDMVFCISLRTSTDRQELFNERWPELIESGKFEWFIVDRDTENPKRGCYTSHKRVLDEAKRRGYNRIITFEDDADMLVPWSMFVNNVNDIPYPDDWKIISLGYFPIKTTGVINFTGVSLLKINCALGTHGYISNVDRVYLPDYNEMQVDAVLLCHGCDFEQSPSKIHMLFKPVPVAEGVYGIYPILIKQNSTDSTLGHKGTGQQTYDRNVLVKMSTHINLMQSLLALIIIVSLLFFIGSYFIARKYYWRRR